MTKLTTRRSLLLAAALALSAVALPASANWWTSSPQLTIGSKSVNVRNYGAQGNGQHDDTSAIQAAINALPSTGGTVYVPAGNYMINALRSISLRSHVRLKLDSSAQLIAIPNSSERYYVVKVWNVNNVEIVGGKIVGERAKHRGSTGQWGYGLNIEASKHVNVHDISIADCWGDGIWVGAIGPGGRAIISTDVTINHVVASNNRRQGMSIGPVDRLYVVNSTFTKSNGFIAQNGIDIEPQTQGIARNVRIENNVLSYNRSNGLEVHDNVTGIVVKSNTIKGNYGYGVMNQDGDHLWIAENLITENGLDGVIMARTAHDSKITSNTITYNSTRWFVANKRSIYMKTNSARDIQVTSSTWGIEVAGNKISPKP